MVLKTVSLRTCLVLWLAMVGGCGISPSEELASASAISFTEPGFYLAPGAVLSWRSDVVYLFEDPAERPEAFRPFLQQEVQAQLEGRGYRFEPTQATHGIVALAVIGSDYNATEILRQYRLSPSFPASRRYARGTLLVAIYSLEDEKIRWRGSVQANIDVTEPEQARRDRVRTHVKRLLGLVPARDF